MLHHVIPHLTEDKLRSLAASGRSFRQIAALYRLSPSTIGYWAKDWGIVANQRNQKGKLPADLVPLVNRLIKEGWTQKRISDLFQVSQVGVWRFLKRHGIECSFGGAR